MNSSATSAVTYIPSCSRVLRAIPNTAPFLGDRDVVSISTTILSLFCNIFQVWSIAQYLALQIPGFILDSHNSKSFEM